jgi:hypothetical protein
VDQRSLQLALINKNKIQSPQEIEEKNSKKVLFGYLYRSKYIIFGPKKCLKNYLAAFGTWCYLQKFFLKTRVVPGTKNEVIRYSYIKKFFNQILKSFSIFAIEIAIVAKFRYEHCIHLYSNFF